MQDSIDQSGNKEIWKKDEILSHPRKKYYNKRRESKIKKSLKKIKKWYDSTFRANTIPNPYKYINRQRRITAAKKRKKVISDFKLFLKDIFAKNEEIQAIKKHQRKVVGHKKSKIQRGLKKLGLKPISALIKKGKEEENIYVKYQRRILLKNIKEPITKLFKRKQKKVASKTKKGFKYYFEREQRKLRAKRISQLKSNIFSFPARFLFETFRIFKIIFSFKKEYRLLKEDILRVKTNIELRNRLIYTYLNSTLSFLISFIIIFFINQYVTVYVCSLFHIPTILHSLGGFINYSSRYRQIMDYFDIIYLVGPYSYLWTRFNIIVIYGTAPFLSLLLAVIFYKLFGSIKSKVRFLKIFFLWSLINSFNMFFGAYIVGAITRTGFIKFSEWIFFSRKYDIEEIIIMVCSMIVLITIGFFSRTFFLISSDHKELTLPRNRTYYLLAQVLLPYLTGIFFLLLISFPNFVHYNMLIYLPIALIVVTAVVSPKGYQKENVTVIRHKRDYNILRYGTFFLLLLVLIFKVFFYKGISLV